MADTAAEHDSLITQFCSLTGVAPQEVSFLPFEVPEQAVVEANVPLRPNNISPQINGTSPVLLQNTTHRLKKALLKSQAKQQMLCQMQMTKKNLSHLLQVVVVP